MYKYDSSLPLLEMCALVEVTLEQVEEVGGAEVACYGHLGDGNIHLNLSVPEYGGKVGARIEPSSSSSPPPMEAASLQSTVHSQVLHTDVHELLAVMGAVSTPLHAGYGQMKNDYVT